MSGGVVRVLETEDAYDVVVARGELDRIGARFASLVPSAVVALITDDNVGPHYAERARTSLQAAGFRPFLHTIPAGEASKSTEQLDEIYAALAAVDADRGTLVIGLGGGVVGDLAGFAAATWKRGVAFGLVPTSLLAMVDASIGGKTGINRPEGKNVVGAFHQPRAVISDPDLLATLPPEESRAGRAEAVKTAIIADAELFDGLEAADDEEIVLRCARAKGAIVTRDVHDDGERRRLNLGHTLGHALETTTGHGTLRHGEAVAIGLSFIAQAAVATGRLAERDGARITDLLKRLGLPTTWPTGADLEHVLATIRQDKKAKGGEPLWIVPTAIGATSIESLPDWPERVSAFAG